MILLIQIIECIFFVAFGRVEAPIGYMCPLVPRKILGLLGLSLHLMSLAGPHSILPN